jgi:hypothetical protein
MNRCGYSQPRWEIYWDGIGSILLEFRITYQQDSANSFSQLAGTLPQTQNPIVMDSPWNMYYGLDNPYHNVVSFEIYVDGHYYYGNTMEIEISCPPDTY